MPQRIRILIADDHALVAEALKKMLERDYEIAGVVHDGRALVEAAAESRPDVVLVDIGMPKLNGLDAANRIRRTTHGCRIIYLTMNADPLLHEEAIAHGASAFLPKTVSREELCAAIRAAVPASSSESPEAVTKVDDEVTDVLTDRQRDVLQLLAEGLSMKQVGGILNLATRTIAFHKYRIMETLGLKNDAELFQFAISKRIVFLDGTRGAPDRTIPQGEPNPDPTCARAKAA